MVPMAEDGGRIAALNSVMATSHLPCLSQGMCLSCGERANGLRRTGDVCVRSRTTALKAVTRRCVHRVENVRTVYEVKVC